MKFAGEVDVAQGTKGLNFGGDPDYDPDPWVFKKTFHEIFRRVGRGPRNDGLDFGAIRITIRNQELFKVLYLLLRVLQTAKNKLQKSSAKIWTLRVLSSL